MSKKSLTTKLYTQDSTSIILVRPQMGENIGATARVMKNFGLTDLRIVAPRDGWPNPKARDMAVTAVDLLDNAKIYKTLEEGIADIQYLYAATVRKREMVKPVHSSVDIAKSFNKKTAKKIKCGVMFGAERTGLSNDEVNLADAIVTIPVNPQFYSLNLAQSVAIICYELYTGTKKRGVFKMGKGTETPAKKEEIIGFFRHLESELEQADHFKSTKMKYKMIENLRNLFLRADLTQQEIRTLRGVVNSLVKGKKSD